MGFIIKAGNLNTRIELQSKTTTYDAMGQPIQAWATDYTVSASVKPLSSREAYFAKAIQCILHKYHYCPLPFYLLAWEVVLHIFQ